MFTKKITLYLFLFCCLTCIANPYTVVIDAGHGGKDAGAVGHVLKLKEKDLNLDVSLRLASKIRTAYPDMNVVLTRSTDVFLPLQERADIVNKNNADLFICIHTNSADSRAARGAETFILGTERMEANLDVAMRENSVIKLEQDYQTTYQGFDPNSIDSYIMFELMQNRYMNQSLQFASMVQNRFVGELKRDDRGVRQAAFWVLLKSACPSVLIEMGFISNKDEEKYMASDKGKRELTEAIYSAFCQYYTAISPSENRPEKKDTVLTSTSSQPQVQHESQPKPQSQPKVQPEPQPKVQQSMPVAEIYRIQIFSSRKVLPAGDKEFKGLKGCVYEKKGEWYKYMYGNYATEQEAQEAQNTLKAKFPDCFIVKVKK